MDTVLNKIYHDPKHSASFGGVQRLKRGIDSLEEKISTKNIESFLRKKQAYTLHKDVRKKFKSPVTKSFGIDNVWQIDLSDMRKLSSYNAGYNYLFFIVDVFSKFLFVRPLKTKTGEEVSEVFADLINETGRKPGNMHGDQGLEFFNVKMKKICNELDINLYYTGSNNKASTVERVQRTIKERIFRYFTFKNTKKYIDVLQDFVTSYNNSIHRSIGLKPSNVREKDSVKLYDKMYPRQKSKRPKFKVGDTVRISRLKDFMKKGYTKGWSEEIFTVDEIINRDVVSYKLKDSNGDDIKGSFLSQELQLIENDLKELYTIEKIIRTEGKGRNKKHLVKWKFWPEKFNSYVFHRDIVRTK